MTRRISIGKTGKGRHFCRRILVNNRGRSGDSEGPMRTEGHQLVRSGGRTAQRKINREARESQGLVSGSSGAIPGHLWDW